MKRVAMAAALAVLHIGNNHPNNFRGSAGDNKGQDTLLGLGAGDTLVGRSAADRLEGNDGNDTLDGGPGEDKIFTGRGFDFVYACDGDKGDIDYNGQKGYRIIFDANLDDINHCPWANTDVKKINGVAVRGKGSPCRTRRPSGFAATGPGSREGSGLSVTFGRAYRSREGVRVEEVARGGGRTPPAGAQSASERGFGAARCRGRAAPGGARVGPRVLGGAR